MKRKDVMQMLKAYGWTFVRHGKGSHQIWQNSETGAQMTVHSLGKSTDFSRGVAKALAKDIQSRGVRA